MNRSLSGLQSRSERGGEENNITSSPLPAVEPSRAARSLITILTELPRLEMLLVRRAEQLS